MKLIAIITCLMLAVTTNVSAQSEWEIPESAKQTATPSKKKKDKKEKDKKEKDEAADKASAPKMKIEQKYAAGTVPLVDGKVEWSKDITVEGCCSDTLYQHTLDLLTQFVKSEGQTEKSRIAAVNKTEKIVVANCEEELVFSSSTFARDYTIFRYTIIAQCSDNKVNIRLCRISYRYDMGRPTEATYTAEEWITDEAALNKKGTNLYRLNGKFRKKTIDRKDSIFALFDVELKKSAK